MSSVVSNGSPTPPGPGGKFPLLSGCRVTLTRPVCPSMHRVMCHYRRVMRHRCLVHNLTAVVFLCSTKIM